MKKISTIALVCLLYSINTRGQQNKTELMRMSIPKGSVSLSTAQLKNLTHSTLDDNMASAFKDHIYKKNNLLMYYLYSEVTGPQFKRSLEFRQKLNVSLLSGDSELKSKTYIVDTSKIITVNNIRFLIIEYHDDNIGYVSYTSDYDAKLHFINGFIEYKKPDETEAKQYLKDLLQSVH